ncbi:hypothetical protein [Aeromonas caviae]|uniref:hypothetical protein n=1 Tax=Aeromonas caviae TaxID=648 RepID=UPI000B0D01DD|nr:hypothetical protein [Aeromonas caviae]
MSNIDLNAMAQDLGNWLPMAEIPARYPQFGKLTTMKHLFWKRAEHPGLERCSRMIGKKLFINVPLFGLWMAGGLPEQQG